MGPCHQPELVDAGDEHVFQPHDLPALHCRLYRHGGRRSAVAAPVDGGIDTPAGTVSPRRGGRRLHVRADVFSSLRRGHPHGCGVDRTGADRRRVPPPATPAAAGQRHGHRGLAPGFHLQLLHLPLQSRHAGLGSAEHHDHAQLGPPGDRPGHSRCPVAGGLAGPAPAALRACGHGGLAAVDAGHHPPAPALPEAYDRRHSVRHRCAGRGGHRLGSSAPGAALVGPAAAGSLWLGSCHRPVAAGAAAGGYALLPGGHRAQHAETRGLPGVAAEGGIRSAARAGGDAAGGIRGPRFL